MTAPDPRLKTLAYKRLRQWVIVRDGGVCQIRGPRCTVAATDVDHVVPRTDGGEPYDPDNMRAACRQCNNGRNALRTRGRRPDYRVGVAQYQTRL
jgi:5-methylcytosine-specific restriction protein A